MKNNNFPTISNYGYYSSDNYGAHTIKVDIPPTRKNKHGITIYYSYDTCIAFRGFVNSEKQGLFICKNEWGTTTGKHLNFINSNKDIRLDYPTFEKLFKKALANA